MLPIWQRTLALQSLGDEDERNGPQYFPGRFSKMGPSYSPCTPLFGPRLRLQA
jgi:hypothetical protein